MAYTVKRKNKKTGKTYVYETKSVWDKELKQSRQISTYLGIEKKKGGLQPKKERPRVRVSQDFGDVYFLKELSKQIGLDSCLDHVFGSKRGGELLELAIFKIIKSDSFYLYEDWSQTKAISNILSSQDISKILPEIETHEFFKMWCERHTEQSAVYYDITSISTYSTYNLLAERGYNRDKENLDQLNLGIVSSAESELPLFYNLYPGSITDVSTLDNILEFSKLYKLKDMIFVLDCGFFSQSNIHKLLCNKVNFILRLNPCRKEYKELMEGFTEISTNIISVNKEGYYYKRQNIDLKGEKVIAFTFHSESKKAFEFNKLSDRLTEVEEYLKENNVKDLTEYLEKHSLVKFFNDDCTKRIKSQIDKELQSMGKFVLLSNSKKSPAVKVLAHYRNRDHSEKIFDSLKTELGYDRLRTHSTGSAKGTIFVSFIAVILYTYIISKYKALKLSVPEILTSLANIQKFCISDKRFFFSEITKKNRDILKNFDIKIPS
jgi:transposase